MRFHTILLLAVVLLPAALFADTTAPPAEANGITVSGNAEITVSPDCALVGFTAEGPANSPTQTIPKQLETIKSVQQAVLAQGVAREDVWVSSSQTKRTEERPQAAQPKPIDRSFVSSGGWSSMRPLPDVPRLNVKVRNLASLRKVVDAATKAGADPVDDVWLSLTNMEPSNRVIKLAVEDAYRQARSIADGLDWKRGLTPYIANPNQSPYARFSTMPLEYALSCIEHGLLPQTSLICYVKVVYALGP